MVKFEPAKRLDFPKIRTPFVSGEDKVDELDEVRLNLRKCLTRLDGMLDARRKAVETKERLLLAMRGSLVARTESRPGPEAKLGDTALAEAAKSLGSIADSGVRFLRQREEKVQRVEGSSWAVAARVSPATRINLYNLLEQEDAEQIKSRLLSYLLEDVRPELPALYRILGSESVQSPEVRFSLFRRKLEHGLGGEVFPRGIARVIYEYAGPGDCKGRQYTLTLSSPYGGLPNNYETLNDGNHGHPGAGTSASTYPWLQATFDEVVLPSSVCVSQPRHGQFQRDGWHTADYLNQVCVLTLPERLDSKAARPSDWIVIGRIQDPSTRREADGVIRIMIDASSNPSKHFRLGYPGQVGNRYLATGTLVFE